MNQKGPGYGWVNKIWRVAYPVLWHYLILNVVTIVGYLLVGVYYSFQGIQDYDQLMSLMNQQAVLFTGISEVVALPLLIYFFIRDKKDFEQEGREKPLKWTKILIICIFSAAFSEFISNVISISGLVELFPAYSQMSEQLFENQNLIIEILSIGILAPVAEEFVFRGLVYKRLRYYWGPNVAIVVSSLAFGVYHGNMIQFVFASIVGYAAASIYEQEKTLWAPILCHVSVNMLSVILSEVVGGYSSALVFFLAFAVEFVISLAFGYLLFIKKNKKLVDIENKIE